MVNKQPSNVNSRNSNEKLMLLYWLKTALQFFWLTFSGCLSTPNPVRLTSSHKGKLFDEICL